MHQQPLVVAASCARYQQEVRYINDYRIIYLKPHVTAPGLRYKPCILQNASLVP